MIQLKIDKSLLLFLTFFELGFAQRVDLTVQPNTIGQDVVDATIKKVRASNIFTQDNEFLQRLAYVETKNGIDSKTYADGLSGGIWNVNEKSLLETQNTLAHPKLTKTHFLIAGIFGINWRAVSNADLNIPLYSGLAARIFPMTLPKSIPSTIEEQAEYWKTYYNKTGTDAADNFVKEIREMQDNFRCNVPMDQCIVLDGSGSIAPSDFQKARNFVYNTINTSYCDATRFCLIVYSTNFNTYFTLENRLEKNEMLSIIENVYHPQGMTYTNDAIMEAVRLFKEAYQRPGVPKSMFVFTDGQSTAGVQPGPNEAKKIDITSVAVGIGSGIYEPELVEIANGNEDNVFHLPDFNTLVDSMHRFRTESCSIAQKPILNSEVKDTLLQNEKRYYNFKIPSNGISISVEQKFGKIISYYSYTESTPSSALHDGQFTGSIFLPSLVLVKRSIDLREIESQVFIAVEGLDTDNNYTIFVENGYNIPTTVLSTSTPTTVSSTLPSSSISTTPSTTTSTQAPSTTPFPSTSTETPLTSAQTSTSTIAPTSPTISPTASPSTTSTTTPTSTLASASTSSNPSPTPPSTNGSSTSSIPDSNSGSTSSEPDSTTDVSSDLTSINEDSTSETTDSYTTDSYTDINLN